MKLPLYEVNAFAGDAFTGNPAAVCPLREWLPDALMQAIAEQNNLAETAFFVPQGDGFAIRWFTPATEVDLCGHATLASAHVLFTELGCSDACIEFSSRSGRLAVTRDDNRLEMDFPSEVCVPIDPPAELITGIGTTIKSCLFNQDYLVVLENESEVLDLKPDFFALAQVEARGIIVTAAAANYDFVCRFFGPAVGIQEDPVTGSAFTKLVPYWAEHLGRTEFAARQVSKRGGNVWCSLSGDRVRIAGFARTYLQGEINVVVE